MKLEEAKVILKTKEIVSWLRPLVGKYGLTFTDNDYQWTNGNLCTEENPDEWYLIFGVNLTKKNGKSFPNVWRGQSLDELKENIENYCKKYFE